MLQGRDVEVSLYDFTGSYCKVHPVWWGNRSTIETCSMCQFTLCVSLGMATQVGALQIVWKSYSYPKFESPLPLALLQIGFSPLLWQGLPWWKIVSREKNMPINSSETPKLAWHRVELPWFSLMWPFRGKKKERKWLSLHDLCTKFGAIF